MSSGYLTRPDEYLIRYETVEWIAKSRLKINEFIDHRVARYNATRAPDARCCRRRLFSENATSEISVSKVFKLLDTIAL